MKKMLYILTIVLLNFSCHSSKKVRINVTNNSEDRIDSLKISLNKSEIIVNDILLSKRKITSQISTDKSGKNGVFLITYYTKQGAFWGNFGYYANKSALKDSYDLYIFNEGVSEIDKKTPFLKENKNRIITPR